MKIRAFIVAVALATLAAPLQARDSSPQLGEAHTVPMDTRNQLLASLGTQASVIWANPTKNRLEGAGSKGVVPVLERLRKPVGLSRDDRSGVLVWTSLDDGVVRILGADGIQTSLQTSPSPHYSLMGEHARAQYGYLIQEGLLLKATKDRNNEITREVLAELSFEPGLIALDEYRDVIYLTDKWGRVVQGFDVREREGYQLNYEGGVATTRLPASAPKGTLLYPKPRDFPLPDDDGSGGGGVVTPPFEVRPIITHVGDKLPPDPLGEARPVNGFVDLHSHLTAEDAFGGGWYWGKIEGPSEQAVGICDGGSTFGQENHGDLRNLLATADFFGELFYDTGTHNDITHGDNPAECTTVSWSVVVNGMEITLILFEYGCPEEDDFGDWPHANAIAHQQMWEGWIRRAYDGGMKVLVASLVESRLLCNSTKPSTRDPALASCDEMASIEYQAYRAWDFAQQNADWVQIALSSTQARQIIEQGKLALVLSAELTELFPEGDFLAQLDEWHALGLRSIQIVHHANNRFAGAAPLPNIHKAADKFEWWYPNQPLVPHNNFECSYEAILEGCQNPLGLTEEGVSLVQAMMDRGMILDVAHLSYVAFDDVYELALHNYAYPLLYSHAHLWNVIHNEHNGETHHEKYISDAQISKLAQLNSMVGLRPGPETADNHYALQTSSPGCEGGTSWDFAQSVKYAVDRGLNVSFGADFNGFMRHAQPCDSTSVDWELQSKGMAHIGLLPAFITEMEQAGLAPQYVSHLKDESAENFLQLWRRSEWTAGITPVMPAMPIAECTAELSPYASESGNHTVIASLDASASTVYVDGNVIAGFEWDLDDGEGFSSPVPHATTASVSFQSNDALNNCSVSPQVRITDLYGNQSVASCGSFQAVCSVAPTGG